MSELTRLVRRRLVVFGLIAAGLFVCPCWPCMWVYTCYDPYVFAYPVARRAAEDKGYPTAGYFADIVAEPDLLGGCELRFEFANWSGDTLDRRITIRVRRGWCLGGWEVVDMQEESFPTR